MHAIPDRRGVRAGAVNKKGAEAELEDVVCSGDGRGRALGGHAGDGGIGNEEGEEEEEKEDGVGSCCCFGHCRACVVGVAA